MRSAPTRRCSRIPEIDAVYIPLPNSMHVPWSVRALEAGKHVLCEKPMSRRPAEVEEAFAAAERAGRVLEEAFMWRHHPQTLRLRELLDEGVIGRLRMVKASFSFPLADVSDIRMQAGLDGGSLMDVGCYCVSGARLVAGAEPERVYGEQAIGGDGVDVAFAATLRFPDDVIGAFHCGFAVGRRHHLEAIGEDGSLFLADPWHGRIARHRAAPRGRRRADRDRRRRTRTRTSSSTSRARCAARRRRCWASPTRSRRRASSRRSTPRPPTPTTKGLTT